MFLPANWELTKHSNYKGIVKNQEKSNQLALSSVEKDATPIGLLYWNLEEYQIYCKEYNSYQEWLSNRNTDRYTWDIKNNMYDMKNIMHCKRLINVVLEIIDTGTFSVFRPEYKELIAIRQGQVNIKELLLSLNNDKNKIKLALEKPILPLTANIKEIENYLINIRKKQ